MTKRILILGAGLEQTLAIKEAKRLGYFVIACDSDINAPGFKIADLYYQIDIKNVELVYEIGRENKVDGVFSHAVEIPHIVAQVTERLNLPGLSPAIAERATFKNKRIEHLTKSGVPCARFIHVKEINELNDSAKAIGFPLIIKPLDSAGSRGVRLVSSESELQNSFLETIQYSNRKEVLLEEVLSGLQISTESIIYGDDIFTFAIADRNYSKEEIFKPFFIEDGINYPSILSDDLRNQVVQLVERTIRCLEIDFGSAKGDIIIHNGKPKIIEMAARSSGGWFGAGSMYFATGFNLLEPLIQMSVGDIPNVMNFELKNELGCAQRYIIPENDGIVNSIEVDENIEKMPGVKMVVLFLPKIGQKVKKATNHAERFGQIICVGKSREEAIQNCENAIRKIKINLVD